MTERGNGDNKHKIKNEEMIRVEKDEVEHISSERNRKGYLGMDRSNTKKEAKIQRHERYENGEKIGNF